MHTETSVSEGNAIFAEYAILAATVMAIVVIVARWADRRSERPSRAELMRQSANRFKWSSRIEAAFGAGMLLYGLATGSPVGILGGLVFLGVAAVDHWFRTQNPWR
jgi:cytochrome c oxidase assembly factor CtaG